jgi:hypothetical protein
MDATWLATVRAEVCRAVAISEFDNPSSRATATERSATLSEWGNAGAGSGTLKTATSSPPMVTRDARRPNGAGDERDDLEPGERDTVEKTYPSRRARFLNGPEPDSSFPSQEAPGRRCL